MAFGRKRKNEDEAPEAGRSRLTPVDVQQKVFRLAFRGYNEQDVDRFLDQVTEDLAALHEENKRLREEVELRGGGDEEEARRHAEEIIRRAREEAARMRAGATPGPGAVPSPPYLVQEREFLQELAGLIQGHAEFLKREARRARAKTAERRSEDDVSEVEDDREEPEAATEEPGAESVDEGPGGPAEPALEETAPMPPAGEGGDLAEWANPFVTEAGEAGAGGPEGESKENEEPSLRELFWGEE